VSDLTVLEGVYEGTENHIFAFAPTQQSGIQFAVRNLLVMSRKSEAFLTDAISTTGTISAFVSPSRAASRSIMSPCPGKTH
jgi:hypothetical protein